MTTVSLRFRLVLSILCAIVVGSMSISARAADFSYDDWNVVLKKYVDDNGLVDYRGLASDRQALDRFVGQIETTGPKSDPDAFPTREDRLAYYINGYNAQVFKGVLSLSPDAKTVWGFTGTGLGFFVRMKVIVDGETMSLKSLEDDLIREGFKDPRIHAALNCASVGCPKLPAAAFLPERLDEQLDAEMTKFVSEERNCKIDTAAGTATLSKIFDWFLGDFEEYQAAHGGGGLREYINRYRSADSQLSADLKLEFSKYDKSLNRQ
jgi:hypothetical protein